MACLVAAYFILPMRGRWWWLGVLGGLVVVAALLPITIRRALGIRRSEQPLADAIATLIYILGALVLAFATTYYALVQHAPDQMHNLSTKMDALYFTVTVLATVGFGDIVAAGQAARVIVTAQMLFDFVFIGVAIRLVVWVTQERTKEKNPDRA
jgi:hypothetical protein